MRVTVAALLVLAVFVWPIRWPLVWPWHGAIPVARTEPAHQRIGPWRRRLRRFPSRTRRSGLRPQQVLALLEGLAPALGAGLSPGDALALMVKAEGSRGAERARPEDPWRAQISDLAAAARNGHALAPTWHALARHHRSRELTLLAQAWSLSEELGAPLADAVDTAAGLVRQRLRAERRVRAASAGARATMNLLTLLPLGGVALASVFGLSPVSLYLGSPLAIGCLVAGLALVMVGRWLVRRMVRASLGTGVSS